MAWGKVSLDFAHGSPAPSARLASDEKEVIAVTAGGEAPPPALHLSGDLCTGSLRAEAPDNVMGLGFYGYAGNGHGSRWLPRADPAGGRQPGADGAGWAGLGPHPLRRHVRHQSLPPAVVQRGHGDRGAVRRPPGRAGQNAAADDAVPRIGGRHAYPLRGLLRHERDGLRGQPDGLRGRPPTRRERRTHRSPSGSRSRSRATSRW